MPAREAYTQARAAAERALALNPRLAEANTALAVNAFYWTRDFTGSRVLFERALALKPDQAQTHLWFALTLMQTGDVASALREATLAQSLDPTSASILANRALILFYDGRTDEALALLHELQESQPKLRSPPEYLATIYLEAHRCADFLREYRNAATISGNAARLSIADAADAGYARGGEGRMLKAMLGEQRRHFAAGAESAYALAATASRLGNHAAALDYLEESQRRREQDMLGIKIDPAFKPLRGNPRYLRLVSAVGFTASAGDNVQPAPITRPSNGGS